MDATSEISLFLPTHPLLHRKRGQGKIREANDSAREIIEQTNADVLVIYSTLVRAWLAIKFKHIQILNVLSGLP